jgi:hypothetical protein
MAKVRSKSNAHIDQAKVQLEKDAARIIHSGTLEEFKEMLRKAGIDTESARGRELINRMISLGASGRSPR